MNTYILQFRFVIVTLLLLLAAFQPCAYHPPREPDIKPIVTIPRETDLDGSRVDDKIEEAIARIKTAMKSDVLSTTGKKQLAAQLNQRIPIELVFEKRITQNQIDVFLAAGGAFDHIFTHVSYGWTGKMPLERISSLPAQMGASLLGVVGSKLARQHMDEAGYTGRVRPHVWDLGYDGDSSGDDRITIAIIDDGVDGTHADLAGRQEYWKDWTSDNHFTAQDYGHHGSHVAGIALGSGASSGVSPTSISYSQHGEMPSSAGSFSPSPIHIPSSVGTITTWTSTMIWETGGGIASRIGHLNSNSTPSWGLVGSTVSGTGTPLVKTTSSQGNPGPSGTNRWSAYPTKQSGTGTPEYVVNNTVTYAGPGDGYNTFRGVAPDCNWAGMKVFTDAGTGNTLDIGEGIDDAVAQRITHKIKVVNMSLGVTGSPGINTTVRNKVNTAAANGLVMVISAGNSGADGAGSVGESSDPGRAHYCIMVAASADDNQLTSYSSHGFYAPGDSNAGDQDTKPDIVAPGGSTSYESNIMSIDSNTSDSGETGGMGYADQVADDYYNIQGTSMASPYVAGCAALVIDAMQNDGETWDFTGGDALADVLKTKMFLLMTATELNSAREAGLSEDPVLGRGNKDHNEGWGMINTDAAIMAAAGTLYDFTQATDTFGSNPSDKRCWARKVVLQVGNNLVADLTVPVGGDFDMYLFDDSPDTYGNPVILISSVYTGLGTDESLFHTPSSNRIAYLVIKRVSGSGTWTLNGTPSGPTPTHTYTPTQTYTPTNTHTYTPTFTPTPIGQVCASVVAPQDGDRIDGNGVSIKGLPDTNHANVGQVQFQYSLTGQNNWQNIGAADTTYPYYTHWNVSGLTQDVVYDLRAVAQNTGAQDCANPPVITVTIDHTGTRDFLENLSGDEQTKVIGVSSSVDNDIWIANQTSQHAVRLQLPASSLGSDDTLTMKFLESADYAADHRDTSKVYSYGNLDGYIQITLGSETLSGPATIRFEYPDGSNEEALMVYRYDSGLGKWRPLTGRTISLLNNRVEGQTTSFSSFALLEGIHPSKSSIDGWNIVGFPGITHKTTPLELFGDDIANTVYFLTYDEAARNYVDATSLSPGRGYIIWTRPAVTLDAYGSKDYDTTKQVSLSFTAGANQGFNFVSNPYTATVDWDTQVARNNVRNQFWTWDGTQYQYWIGGGGGTLGSGQIPPWTGFWVEALNNTSPSITFTRPVSSKPVLSTQTTDNPLTHPTVDHWRLQLSLTCGDLIDENNYIGTSPISDSGPDDFDVKELGTLLDDYILLYFMHPEWNDPGSYKYAQDVRSPSDSQYEWTMEVDSTQPGSIATLSWPNINQIPPEWQFSLRDNSTGIETVLRGLGLYTFALADGTSTLTITAQRVYIPSAGDLNEDGRVTYADLFLLSRQWQSTSSKADFNNDRQVDGNDLLLLIENWH
jgi:Subtilase family/Dockerin type I domain